MSRLTDLIDRSTQAIDFFKGRSNALLKKYVIDLNAAGGKEINLAGNFIYAIDGTDSIANVDVRFSRNDADVDAYNLVKSLGVTHPFDKLYLSWSAQASKTLTLWIGNLAPDLLSVIDNRSNVASDVLLTAILAQLTGTVTAGNFGTVQVLAAAGGIIIRPALATRKSLIIQNLPGNTGNLYLGYADTVSATTCFVCLAPGQSWSCDDYLGDVYGIQTVNLDRATYGEAI